MTDVQRDHIHDPDPRVPAVPCWCGWERPATESEWDAARDRITETNDAVRAERERIRPLVARWREAARSLESHNALWSSHFYDCAHELERVLGEPPAETNDAVRAERERIRQLALQHAAIAWRDAEDPEDNEPIPFASLLGEPPATMAQEAP